MKCVADTSWLIAHFNAADTFHAKARRQFAEADLVHIPAAIWVEFLNVFQYRFGGHPAAMQAGAELRRGRNVRIGDVLADENAQRVWRRNPRLTYADSAAVAEAKRLGFELCTFERAQQEALAAEA